MANYQFFSYINVITRSVNDSNDSNSNIDHIFVKNVLSDTISSYIASTSIY